MGDNSVIYDFYTCEADGKEMPRSIIARHGNRPEEYQSVPLFGCAELTDLDKLALFRGLELTTIEEARLLSVLARMYRDKLNRGEYLELGGSLMFGRGNVMFDES